LFGLVKLVVCLLCSGRVMLLAGAWFGACNAGETEVGTTPEMTVDGRAHLERHYSYSRNCIHIPTQEITSSMTFFYLSTMLVFPI
jgi:hypothetical protein